MRTPVGVLLAALAACALSGCSLVAHSRSGSRSATHTTAGARTSPSSPSPAAVAATRRTHELPTPARRPSVTGGWRTPAGAVRAFASVYINWTALTVAGRLRSLARASVGQARAALALQAQEVAGDDELRAGGVTNAGTVQAVARLPGAAQRYAVVTRERTGALYSDAYRGLAPAWHVSLATVTRTGDGLWVLSGWQPEN